MTETEEKSLRAQIALYKDVVNCDAVILAEIMTKAKGVLQLLNSLYGQGSHPEHPGGKVSVPIEDLLRIKKFLLMVKDPDGLESLSNSINAYYLIPRKEKLKILEML